MNKQDARTQIALFGDLSDEQRQTCAHGHPQCSVSAGGACFDDLILVAVGWNCEPSDNTGAGDC